MPKICLCVFFSGHSLWERKNINKIPPKVPGQSRESSVYVFFSLCVFFSLPKKGEKGRFRAISGKGGQTPLKPPFVTPRLRQPNRYRKWHNTKNCMKKDPKNDPKRLQKHLSPFLVAERDLSGTSPKSFYRPKVAPER